VLQKQTVLVQGGWITAIGPSGQVPVPAGATTIEGRGKYLIPGLANMHAHGPSNTAGLLAQLASGVTLLRIMNWQNYDDGHADQTRARGEHILQLRARAAAGEILSPRLYVATQWFAQQDVSNARDYKPGESAYAWHLAPAGVAARIAAYKAKGYDFIKPYFEPPAIFDSVAAAAHRLGMSLEGHVPPDITLQRALSVPLRSIEHSTGYFDQDKQSLQSGESETLARSGSGHRACGGLELSYSRSP
jgi:hypothetical protein